MKIKLILVLAAFLTHAVFAAAQSPTKFAANDMFSIHNKSTAVNRIAGLLQNSAGNFNALTAMKIPVFANQSAFNKSNVNCNDSASAFAPEAAPCNGVSVTSISFTNANRTIESGADKTVGVVYRYTGAGTAPDGTVVDALVTVQNYANNQDATPTTFLDADTTAVGFAGNLQPSIDQETGTFATTTSVWTGSITYRIQFVVTGTTTPRRISVAATSIDNDGSSICGVGLRESVTYSSNRNQTLINTSTPAPGTTQVVAGDKVTGPTTTQTDIGVGSEYSNSALYINVTELNWTYSFATDPGGTCTAGATTQNRYGSLNLSCQVIYNRPFASVSLSGTVFDDANGLTDSTVNGTGTGLPGGAQLYANLLDANNFVVSSAAVAADGTYTFPAAVPGAYNVQISTNQGIESSAAPIAALPAGWVNTGENLGAGTGSDGSVDGLVPVTIATAAITNANFGIEQRPAANTNTAANQTNPGGTNNATVPATVFTATDAAPGNVANIRIIGFPINATSININGTQYTAATFPAGGVTVPTNTGGNPTQAILVDPINGATTVVIPFVALDNAGVVSSATATANVPFVTVSISGTIFNDVNGLTDGIVNGAGTNAGGSLFVNLLDSSNVVVQTDLLPASGAYSFNSLNVGNYTVQVSTVQGTIGGAAPATALPGGWVNTGEFVGTVAGNDGGANGLLSVTVASAAASVSNANFGIEQRPVANNNTAPSQMNPGGTVNAAIPPAVFTATDTANVSSIRITAFPTNVTTVTINGTQYTAANFPAGGVTIPTNSSGNPTQAILVDPISGAVRVSIRFVAIDNANVASSPDASAATVNIPFNLSPTAAAGEISGTLHFGENPVPNALVVLLDTNSNSRVFTRTDARGNYIFKNNEVGKTYIVQPLSSKYTFGAANGVVNLLGDETDLNFEATAKKYHPKNDFDGDGKSDAAVFRPSDGNWYVLRSSDDRMSVFNFGLAGDIPVSADFDGDGKTDYAVFRPSEGNWYIWQSKTQDLRVENFGLAGDKLVPADYDGDGRADIAVYRNGNWYVLRSSDGAFQAQNFGLETDAPVPEDFDGDGRADFSVYRPSDGIWYSLRSQNDRFSAEQFGLATDVPVAGDYDGDGRADIAQFRNGNWYALGSTTDFEAIQLGTGEDKSIVGDYDGDGRADTAVYRNGLWLIRNSVDGTVRRINFGLPTDVPVK